MSRKNRAFSLSVIVLLTACGAGDDSAPEAASSAPPSTQATAETGEQAESSAASSDATGATVGEPKQEAAEQDVEADQAAAEAALLILSDFPAGWSEVPDTDNDDEPMDRRQAECLGSSGTEVIDTKAKAETGLFTNPDEGSFVQEVVGLAESAEDAILALVGFGGDDVTRCLTEVYNDRFRMLIEESADLGEAEVGQITVGALNITPVGDEYYAFRIEIPISVDAFTFTATADLVAVRVGRSLAGLVFFSEDGASPIERIDEYAALAAARLPR